MFDTVFQEWKLVHTYRPYFEEVELMPDTESSKKSKKKKAGQTAGEGSAALKVLVYLASKLTDTVKILATMQLASSSNPVPYKKLKDELMKNMVVPGDTKLRSMLKELTDHNIVGWDKDGASNELVFVPSNIPLQSVINFDKNAYNPQGN